MEAIEKGAVAVAAFYKFVAIPEVEIQALIEQIRVKGESLGIYGLILVAKEGINATVAGNIEGIAEFKVSLRSIPFFCDLVFKDSYCTKIPFRRLAIQYRDEIVTLKAGIGIPNITDKNRLSPQEWNKMMRDRSEDIAIIDVRNDYEVELGKFRGAIDPKTKKFSDFPQFVSQSNIPKDKPVLMYCTGGIRCEKAIEEMYSQGYGEVYQLDGGILRYLEECPDGEFQGECFVFDHRVAVDKHLQPSQKFRLCPHCGNPGTLIIECNRCSKVVTVCDGCARTSSQLSCSKNCAYHLRKL